MTDLHSIRNLLQSLRSLHCKLRQHLSVSVLCPHMKYEFCWYKGRDINASSPLTAASVFPTMSAHSERAHLVALPSCAPGLGVERSLNYQLSSEMQPILPGYTAHC